MKVSGSQQELPWTQAVTALGALGLTKQALSQGQQGFQIIPLNAESGNFKDGGAKNANFQQLKIT